MPQRLTGAFWLGSRAQVVVAQAPLSHEVLAQRSLLVLSTLTTPVHMAEFIGRILANWPEMRLARAMWSYRRVGASCSELFAI